MTVSLTRETAERIIEILKNDRRAILFVWNRVCGRSIEALFDYRLAKQSCGRRHGKAVN